MNGLVAPVVVKYSRLGDAYASDVPAGYIEEILMPFDGRRRAFLVALLNGYSKGAAAASVGLSARTPQLWAKKEPTFAEAVAACEDIGFGTVLESELYRRALAGPSDGGSMRALELVLKSRDERYRDVRRTAVVSVAR